MIMVRRRARPAKEPALMVVTSASNGSDAAGNDNGALTGLPMSVVAAVATAAGANNHLLDDQYFASPKRKDCRLMKANENLKATSNGNNSSSSSSSSTKCDSGRIIGVPLATRSQTRTIENFFKANANAKKMMNSIQPTEATPTPTPIEIEIETGTESEDQKTITTLSDAELDEETLLYDGRSSTSNSNSSPEYQPDDLDMAHLNYVTYTHSHTDTETDAHTDIVTQTTTTTEIHHIHRSALRDSHSSTHSSSSSSCNSSSSSGAATSDNIFLQEPVLTLDIDRTPTKASSMRINKSFEPANAAVFSSPPSVLSACVLNGRFNQIVTLNGHVHDQEQEQQLVEQQQPLNGFDLDQHDSSSCDSGVACSLTTTTTTNMGTSPAATSLRRRKPATPHRIVCPSPIKTIIPRDAGMLKSSETQSPRKSPRKLQMQMQMQLAATNVACKSRRRLNQPKPQAPYQHQHQQSTDMASPMPMSSDDVDVLLVGDDDEDEDDVRALLKTAEERENLNKPKTMLKPITTTTIPAATLAVKPKAPAKSAKAKTLAAKSQPLAATNGNREMTDFFPVRRSVRKTKTAVKEEMMRNLEQAVLEERCEGLEVRHFMGKGRGVVAERRFHRNEFVVEYVGDLIAISEATERERRYALDENAGCYMYYFKHKNQQYCIDATVDTGKLGRLINHSRNGNLMTKVVVIKQRPHLVLLAKDDIEPGEELTYDYGDRSKESLLHHPWLAF